MSKKTCYIIILLLSVMVAVDNYIVDQYDFYIDTVIDANDVLLDIIINGVGPSKCL